MTATVSAFPLRRVRQLRTLPPARRADYLRRLQSIAEGLTRADGGEMTKAERDQFAHGFVAAIEAARDPIQGAT